jgi:hypothetical protein
MALKDELLIFWVFCSVMFSFVIRHLFDGAVYLAGHSAAASVLNFPVVLHSFAGHLR